MRAGLLAELRRCTWPGAETQLCQVFEPDYPCLPNSRFNTPMIRVSYRLTAEDIIASQHVHRTRSLPNRVFWKAAIAFSMLLAAAGLLAQFFPMWRPLGQFFILFAAIFYGIQLLQRWQWSRAIQKTPAFNVDQHAEFSEDRFLTTSTLNSGDVNWAGIIDAVEGPAHFVLYPSPSVLYCIPKRAFDADQLAELRVLLARKIRSFRAV